MSNLNNYYNDATDYGLMEDCLLNKVANHDIKKDGDSQKGSSNMFKKICCCFNKKSNQFKITTIDGESKELVELRSKNIDSLLRFQNDIKSQDNRVEKITKFASLQESNCKALQKKVDKLNEMVKEAEGMANEIPITKKKIHNLETNLHKKDDNIHDLNSQLSKLNNEKKSENEKNTKIISSFEKKVKDLEKD